MSKKKAAAPAAQATPPEPAAPAPAPGEGEEPTPVPTPTPADEESEQAARDRKVAAHRFSDDKRNAIFAHHQQSQNDSVAAFLESDPEQALLAAAIASGDDSNIVYDAAGNAVGVKRAAAPAAPAAAAPPVAPAPAGPPGDDDEDDDDVATPAGRKFKITVYGEPVREADEDEVIRAGVAALQKDGASDMRMRGAAEYEKNLRAYALQLQGFADSLAAGRTDPASTSPTPSGVAGVVDEASVKQAFELVSDGKPDEAAKLVTKAIRDAVAAGRADTSPTPAPRTTGAVPSFQVPTLPAMRSRTEIVEANTVFEGEYGELVAEDAAFTVAQSLIKAKLADPANTGRSATDLVREVGNFVRASRRAPAGPAGPAPSHASVELGARRTLKARVALTPPVAAGRAPGAPEAPRFPSNADYVQQLRKRSGSNTTR